MGAQSLNTMAVRALIVRGNRPFCIGRAYSVASPAAAMPKEVKHETPKATPVDTPVVKPSESSTPTPAAQARKQNIDNMFDHLTPKIALVGVGGAGANAVNNMVTAGLGGVDFMVCNTDAQALMSSECENRVLLGDTGLGAGAKPDYGRRSAEGSTEEVFEVLQELSDGLPNMLFLTAGMGGGTGTGASPVIARHARELGILTVAVVTKPFNFEGAQRMRLADAGLADLEQHVDTLIVIPNQNLFKLADSNTTFANAFQMADDVLHQGVRSITDLMVKPGLINLDFADVQTVMKSMGRAMMGTGQAEGENRASDAAMAALHNPLLDTHGFASAKGLLINITGGPDMTLFDVDSAANTVREQVEGDSNAPEVNIIFGSAMDEELEGQIRVSIVATGTV